MYPGEVFAGRGGNIRGGKYLPCVPLGTMLHANTTGTENAMPNLPDEKNPEMCLQALADEEGAQ